jgi:hypothetical protein
LTTTFLSTVLVRFGALLVPLGWFSWSTTVCAQDLVPGAFIPAPVGLNIVTLAASFNDGDLAFDSSLPVKDGHAAFGSTFAGYTRTLNIAGRSAGVGVGLPYVMGHLEGAVAGQFQQTSRSGLGDLVARVAINLYGAPALSLKQFAAYRPTTILGISLTVGMPTGQYDPARYVNIGTNRWLVKPEVGFSRTRGRWTFEGDVSASLFTDNTKFVNGSTLQEAPIAAVQGHLIYTMRPGLWLAGDGNLWTGGRLTTNGTPTIEEQRNSRLGLTLALPIARRQVRVAYSLGAYTTIGGAFQSVGLSYSYAWARQP